MKITREQVAKSWDLWCEFVIGKSGAETHELREHFDSLTVEERILLMQEVFGDIQKDDEE